MTDNHARFGDLLAVAALGAADPDEVAEVRAHATECVVCADELLGLEKAAGVLALAVADCEPPDRLRARVLNAAWSESAPASDAAQPPARVQGVVHDLRAWLASRAPRGRFLVPVATAALVLVVGLGSLDRSETASPVASATALVGLGAEGQDSAGSIARFEESDVSYISARGLPAPDSGTEYVVWRIRDGRSQALGVLEGANPSAVIVRGVSAGDEIAVTLEPVSDRLPSRPSSPPVMSGSIA
ncbi:anti-sigma factor [Miltoncostaea oceani]|uniref:anti-sigma factor n=1 Tax=Miltoncostaea oceani TaxID=2843216 RepID=UPI001C3C3F6E|nr:anti-sigma factor [Miltoncostaea oceani]